MPHIFMISRRKLVRARRSKSSRSHRNPVEGVYQEVRELRVGDSLSPQSFPDIQIPVADLFA
jgi:hypothetical protein